MNESLIARSTKHQTPVQGSASGETVQTAQAFLRPFEWQKWGERFADYPDIVKNAMDLQTVREKLNSGAYDAKNKSGGGGACVSAFLADLRLIFANALLYNKDLADGSNKWIRFYATTLDTLVEEEIGPVLHDRFPSGCVPPPLPPLASLDYPPKPELEIEEEEEEEEEEDGEEEEKQDKEYA